MVTIEIEKRFFRWVNDEYFKTKQKELQMIFIAVIIIFAGFLLLPFIEILYQSIAVGDGVGLKHFATMLDEDKFATAFGNSIAIASTSAILSTLLAFILAYTIHYTNINKTAKRLIQILAIAPMFYQQLHMDLQ